MTYTLYKISATKPLSKLLSETWQKCINLSNITDKKFNEALIVVSHNNEEIIDKQKVGGSINLLCKILYQNGSY